MSTDPFFNQLSRGFRFFFSGELPAGLTTIAYDDYWNFTTDADGRRYKLCTSREEDVDFDSNYFLTNLGPEQGPIPIKALIAQYVSDPLSVHSLVGNVRGQILCHQSSAAEYQMCRAMIVKIVNGAGTFVRSYLYEEKPTEYSNGFPESAFLDINFEWPSETAIEGSAGMEEGDRLVVELGVVCFSPDLNNYPSSTISVSDHFTKDLPAGLTINDYPASMNTWIEYGGTIPPEWVELPPGLTYLLENGVASPVYGTYSFTPSNTTLRGINDLGEVVGTVSGNDFDNQPHSMMVCIGPDYPWLSHAFFGWSPWKDEVTNPTPVAINNDHIKAASGPTPFGYVDAESVHQDVTAAEGTEFWDYTPLGINDSGVILGYKTNKYPVAGTYNVNGGCFYTIGSGFSDLPLPPGFTTLIEAWVYDPPGYTTLSDFRVWNLNNDNIVVGSLAKCNEGTDYYEDGYLLNGPIHGFIYNVPGSTVSIFDYPGGVGTSFCAISNNGVIVGYSTVSGVLRSFVFEVDESFTDLDFSSMPYSTGATYVPYGINNDRVVVGFYDDSSNVRRGFSASPTSPGSTVFTYTVLDFLSNSSDAEGAFGLSLAQYTPTFPTPVEAVDIDLMEYATDGGAQTVWIATDPDYFQVYSEPSVKYEGSYSLKITQASGAAGVGAEVSRTFSPGLDLTNNPFIRFNFWGTLAGSPIGVVVGGWPLEVNVSTTNAWVTLVLDVSGLPPMSNLTDMTIYSNSNDAGTFYIDNLYAEAEASVSALPDLLGLTWTLNEVSVLLPPSYGGIGGTGDRRGLIAISDSANGLIASFDGINVNQLINGAFSGTTYFGVKALSAAYWIKFDFLYPAIVDEAKWYQSNTTAEGTWKFQGSNNDVDWSDIGSSFVLGGVATQTLTQLNGNTTPYRYLRLVGVSGNTSSSPYIREIEFQISYNVNSVTPAYGNAGSVGDRTATVTLTTDVSISGGVVTNLINGAYANAWYFLDVPCAGKFFKFDFGVGASKVIDEAKWYQSTTTAVGTWKWQGSNNNSDWADIGSSFTLGGALILTLTQLNGNTAAYRYYRLLGVSGSTSSNPWIYEMDFRIGDQPPDVTVSAELVGLAWNLHDVVVSLPSSVQIPITHLTLSARNVTVTNGGAVQITGRGLHLSTRIGL